MHFLFVVPRFHTNLYFAIQSLLARGHTVSMVTRSRREGFGMVEPTPIGKRTTLRSAWRILRRENPDVIVLRNLGPGWLCFYYLSLLLPRRPKVIEYHLKAAHRRPPFMLRVARALRLRPATHITPVLRRGAAPVPASGAVYAPLPVVAGAGAKRSHSADGVVRILCVGRLRQPRKQHNLLLDALEPLARDHAFEITFAGAVDHSRDWCDDYHRRLLGRIFEGPLAGRVTLQADVPYAEMADLYRAHDLFVMPAYGEPLGIAAPEAMANGCAVVVSDTCGSCGYIAPGTGLTFRDRDMLDLRETLAALLRDPPRIAAMGRAAAAAIERDHAPGRYAIQMEQLAAAGPRRRAARAASSPTVRDSSKSQRA